MADFVIAVVSVPSAGMKWCEAGSILGKSVGRSIWFEELPGTMSFFSL